MEIDRLEFIVIEFELPFVLELEDSVVDDKPGFTVIIDNTVAIIRTIQIAHDQMIAKGAKIRNDRNGILSHSKAYVQIDKENLSALGIDIKMIVPYMDTVFRKALQFLNKFISSYRLASKYFYIYELLDKDFLSYRYNMIYDNGESDSGFSIFNEIHFNGGNNIVLDDNKVFYLGCLLITMDNHFYDELYLSIHDNYDKGLYNLAIIQCAILFEYYVYSTLKVKFQWSNTKKDNYKKCDKCENIIGISEVCTRGLKQDLNIDFGVTEEYINFDTYVIKKRNKLVHGDSLKPISREECFVAINSLVNALNTLEKLFNLVEKKT